MSKSRKLLLTGLLSSLLATSGLALAFGGHHGAHGGCDGAGMTGGSPQMQERMASRMAEHQARLHDALKLTPAQESAWKAYVEKTKPPVASTPPLTREAMEKLSTPERMEKMQEAAKLHLTAMEKHTAALKEFYATLSPEQKKTFDEMHSRGQGRGGPRGAGAGPANAGKGPMPEGKPAGK